MVLLSAQMDVSLLQWRNGVGEESGGAQGPWLMHMQLSDILLVSMGILANFTDRGESGSHGDTMVRILALD